MFVSVALTSVALITFLVLFVADVSLLVSFVSGAADEVLVPFVVLLSGAVVVSLVLLLSGEVAVPLVVLVSGAAVVPLVLFGAVSSVPFTSVALMTFLVLLVAEVWFVVLVVLDGEVS